MDASDVARDDRDPTAEWEGLTATEEEHFLSYTRSWVLTENIFNRIEPMGPAAISTWQHLLTETLRNLNVHRIPELTSCISITASETVSNPNAGAVFQRGTKSRKRVQPKKGVEDLIIQWANEMR